MQKWEKTLEKMMDDQMEHQKRQDDFEKCQMEKRITTLIGKIDGMMIENLNWRHGAQERLESVEKLADRLEDRVNILKLVLDHYADIAPKLSEVMNDIQEALDHGRNIAK